MKIILSYYPWRLFSPKNNKCATFLLEIVIPRSQNNEEKLNVTSALRHAKSQWGNKNELFFRLSFWIAGCWKCATNRARVNISAWMLFSNSYSWESKNSAQTTLVVDVLELVWWALHTSWSELWRCMKKRSWHGVYFTNKGKYRNVLLANMRVKLQNVTFASEHVRELSAFGVGRQKQETVHLRDKTEVSYQVLKQNIRKIWTKRSNQNFLLRKPRTRLKSSTRPRVLNNWFLRSWSTPVFHVSALTCGVYESEQNPVNQDLACCLSVEFYAYILGSHIRENSCALLVKRTNGTTGMKRRFDKDKNFKLFTICSKMVTGLCQNIFMSFTSDCTYQIRFVNYLHRLKIPEKSKWYKRHSSVRYVLFCRSTCNFGANQENKLFYNITVS